MKLTDTTIGSQVRITDLSPVHETVRRRLIDLGIVEGVIVALTKRLPFGGPFTLESNGQWIAIRRKEALQILVEAV